MFVADTINLDSLNLAPAYERILEFHGYTTGIKLLDALEVYKIFDRETLLNKLNANCKRQYDYISKVDEEFIYTVDNALEPKKLKRERLEEDFPPELQKVIDKFGVAIEVSGESLIIFSSIATDFDLDALTLALVDYPSEIIFVTPKNFREITNAPEPERDLLFLMRRIAVECMKVGGSDLKLDVIHENRKPRVRVQFRVDETIIESKLFMDITVSDEEFMLKKLLQDHSSLTLADIDSGYAEGYIQSIICDSSIESRFGISKLLTGYYINIRIQALTPNNFSVDKLGLDYDTVAALEYTEKKLQGLTVITGPMKSGKSTTMWGMMGDMLKLPICCIEYSSPLEVKMELPQIDYNNNLQKLKGLLSVAKKQDINVAFLNEIPNAGIAQGVRDLLNSNVHVVTTFHLDRIWDLPHKLYEYYGDSYKNMMSQINLVVNQKMYVKQCPHCKTERLVQDLPSTLSNFLSSNEVTVVWDNKGCKYCNNGALKGGRIPKTEWILFDDQIIEDLRGYAEPRDMEKYLKDMLLRNEQFVSKRVALDYKLLDSIRTGELSYKELYTLKTLGGKLNG